MILEEGRTIKDVAESLDLNYYTLRDWKIQWEERGDKSSGTNSKNRKKHMVLNAWLKY